MSPENTPRQIVLLCFVLYANHGVVNSEVLSWVKNIPNYAQLSLACQSSPRNMCCLISVSYHLGGSSLSVSQLIRNHRYLPCAVCARVLHILQKWRINEYSIWVYFEAALIHKNIFGQDLKQWAKKMQISREALSKFCEYVGPPQPLHGFYLRSKLEECRICLMSSAVRPFVEPHPNNAKFKHPRLKAWQTSAQNCTCLSPVAMSPTLCQWLCCRPHFEGFDWGTRKGSSLMLHLLWDTSFFLVYSKSSK